MVFAMQPEIQAYFEDVASKYNLAQHVRFSTLVESALWEEQTATWLVKIRELPTGKTSQLRCKVLVSAVGVLSTPKKCDIPGAYKFQGRLFHSAEWDHSFDWEDKVVITIGMECSP